MSSLQNVHKPIFHIKEQLQELVSHSYLMRFIDQPYIDDDKLALLYAMFSESGVEEHKRSDCIKAVMLVQIALDTHDQITSNGITNDTERKNRQLTVLAGDFFSSLYYRMLSERNDIGLVRILSEAIQDINELKMCSYTDGKQDLERVLHLYKSIESLVVKKVGNYLGTTALTTFSHEVLWLKRLIFEKKNYVVEGTSGFVERIGQALISKTGEATGNEKESALEVIDACIEEARKKTGQQPELNRFFGQNFPESIFNITYSQKKIAEEG
ncbi:heptaprenyl diphosphate synthase component 1 [Pseudalkalibacillus caeni]|uniref:Heptaprenyl diphosphate synthase n=1 Tax=Exobacillus caeni TaxID=2574798 RepID=A0A5R9F529_9BACL|nr:heptaprenyl diphosphate synthase component 1 [Pseudalkalibacillus caeni]TLS35923.1 heptaprenyl diphosphate synthase [Pseudalkalibacillus caeni]